MDKPIFQCLKCESVFKTLLENNIVQPPQYCPVCGHVHMKWLNYEHWRK